MKRARLKSVSRFHVFDHVCQQALNSVLVVVGEQLANVVVRVRPSKVAVVAYVQVYVLVSRGLLDNLVHRRANILAQPPQVALEQIVNVFGAYKRRAAVFGSTLCKNTIS